MNKITLVLQRILATFLDFALLAIVAFLIIKFLDYDFEQVLASALITNIVGFGLLFLLEAVLVSTWGTTPGMRLFGLSVKNLDCRLLGHFCGQC